MKKLNLPKTFILLTMLFIYNHASANFGIYESYAVLNDVYYDLFANTGNPDFNGANLGTFMTDGELIFNGGQIKTYKESVDACNSNACGGTIFYTIYLGANPLSTGSFSLTYDVGFGDQSGSGCSINQQWDNDASGTTNLISGLSAGNYTLAVYCIATGSNSDDGLCNETVTQSVLSASFVVEAIMPVEIMDFVLKNTQHSIELNWQTASELNNSHFEIERSADSGKWETLGENEGHGTTLTQHSYSFIDKWPLTGLNYYRLKQVDFNGNFEYSKVISVNLVSNGGKGSISPNPASEAISINLPNNSETYQATVYDLSGKAWQNSNLPNNQLIISELPNGIYFLKITDEIGRTVTQERFVKN
ncbi:MAG: T9SS type A sorting domain-containing protein [Bacteroidetes bacterium]|nr:T9SS type A sorting domain-containing protein [Bacteroidota bacterium]